MNDEPAEKAFEVEAKLPNGLTVKQQAFVDNILAGMSKVEAHEKAGYFAGSQEQRYVMSRKLGQDPNVARALFKARLKRAERTKIESDRVLEEWSYLAFSDPNDFMDFETEDENPRQRPANEIPEHARRAISSIKVKSRSWEQEGIGMVTETSTEYRLWDKNKALGELGKHLGLTPDKVDVTSTQLNVNVDAVSLLAELSLEARIEMLRVLRKRKEQAALPMDKPALPAPSQQ